MRQAFRRVFATRDRDEWVVELGPLDTCVSPVNTIAEVVDDRQLGARDVFVAVNHPEHGRFRQVGPIVPGAARLREAVPVPGPGATDVGAVLAEVGITGEALEALRREGIVG
ncbi:MAG: CoA transferase [Acidimicrobiia bacterium]|nr:CoA transferase [Acidimicrobiia bacterium]